jgi:hypothetical protein
MACYGDSLTILCVDDDGVSQETHLCASTVCSRDRFSFFTYRKYSNFR